MNKRNSAKIAAHAVKYPAAPAEPVVLTRLDNAKMCAHYHAMSLRSLTEYLDNMRKRIAEMPESFDRAMSYARDNMSQRGYDAISFANNMTQNLRVELIAKYAADVQTYAAQLAIYREVLSSDELAELDAYISRF